MSYRLASAPSAERICTVTLEGAPWVVGLGFEEADRDERAPIPAQVWVEHVHIAGAWYDAIDVLADSFLEMLNAQLQVELARDWQWREAA